MWNRKHSTIKIVFKWMFEITAIFLAILIILSTAYYLFEKKYEGHIYPGIYVGKINLSGLSPDEAQAKLNKQINELNSAGIKIEHKEKQSIIFPAISSVEGDFAYDVFSFQVEKTVKNAYDFGRNKTFIPNVIDKIGTLFKKIIIPANFTIHEEEILKNLKNDFSSFETKPKDANLTYNKGNASNHYSSSFVTTPEKKGALIDFDSAIEDIKYDLSSFDKKTIFLKSKIVSPKILSNEAADFVDQANEAIKLLPITLSYNALNHSEDKNTGTKKWVINKEEFIDWIKVKLNTNYTVDSSTNKKIVLGFNNSTVKQFLYDSIAKEINIAPQNAKFEIRDGKVVEFQQSKDGQELNIEATFSKLENEFFKNNINNIDIVITSIKSEIQTEDSNDMGIKEIIGTGHSNFSGSPKNRRHNIKVGADTLNGLTIKPGEEFSLITALGDIDGENGYLPELVIKDNKTVPEFGGGLCQIGTTLFRTVIQSGLPVTMRRNHSYRVSYYEPAGTDATIYDPWPDFRFINDTNNDILIQTRIEGDEIYFDFWGTKDGRLADISEPTIYNITKPPPAKIIETLDLAPGKKRCTERAHSGADAYFDYAVTYQDGEKKEKRFKSHYVPWREVCLLGVEKLSTSTQEVLN